MCVWDQVRRNLEKQQYFWICFLISFLVGWSIIQKRRNLYIRGLINVNQTNFFINSNYIWLEDNIEHYLRMFDFVFLSVSLLPLEQVRGNNVGISVISDTSSVKPWLYLFLKASSFLTILTKSPTKNLGFCEERVSALKDRRGGRSFLLLCLVQVWLLGYHVILSF